LCHYLTSLSLGPRHYLFQAHSLPFWFISTNYFLISSSPHVCLKVEYDLWYSVWTFPGITGNKVGTEAKQMPQKTNSFLHHIPGRILPEQTSVPSLCRWAIPVALGHLWPCNHWRKHNEHIDAYTISYSINS
jgi:hypothetical protein